MTWPPFCSVRDFVPHRTRRGGLLCKHFQPLSWPDTLSLRGQCMSNHVSSRAILVAVPTLAPLGLDYLTTLFNKAWQVSSVL